MSVRDLFHIPTLPGRLLGSHCGSLWRSHAKGLCGPAAELCRAAGVCVGGDSARRLRVGGWGGEGRAAIARADAAGPKMAVGGRRRSSFGMAAPGRGLRLDSVITGFTLGVCMAQFLMLISFIFEAEGLVNQAGPTPGGDLVGWVLRGQLHSRLSLKF